ncbi:glycogen synthase GlgA [Falsibacillus pallidus]|uniref:Glycogen synthase n=1 Tax=Falsibacillus pallidus TaxID=493781 RepID=A0A370GL27_9BACI|nr:glycogen synthase GlgA [Falsibacillus pallidus]RDI44381.1 starch synthase [Falsibacillus pallidus]
MKLLFVVSECVPFAKSGGLADVAGALPKKLKERGHDIRVMMPKYGQIPLEFKEKMQHACDFRVQMGWRNQYCGIEKLEWEGIVYYFVDHEYYFNRSEMYGHFDDGERFSFFCRAVLESFEHLSFFPEIIHCHDWHTGMVPLCLRADYQRKSGYEFIKTVYTIHNLQFQGIFPKSVFTDLLNIDESYYNSRLAEFYGNVNFMKAAIATADQITTVSRTYSKEILTEYYGEKLDGILSKRSASLKGILNGIDYDLYDPVNDPWLIKNYDADSLDGKEANKLNLQESFQLPVSTDIPVAAMISRLTEQKGIDLIRGVFHEILAHDVQLIILGTGDAEYENFVREMADHYPQKVRVVIGFDEQLAHKIYAGADLFLMPSKFEPCGLGQLIAMRYGSVPVVRETGGLKDTVLPFNEFTNEGNGFSFSNYNAHDMLFTIERALKFYHDQSKWKHIVQNAMKQNHSWEASASHYEELYSSLLARRESHVF